MSPPSTPLVSDARLARISKEYSACYRQRLKRTKSSRELQLPALLSERPNTLQPVSHTCREPLQVPLNTQDFNRSPDGPTHNDGHAREKIRPSIGCDKGGCCSESKGREEGRACRQCIS